MVKYLLNKNNDWLRRIGSHDRTYAQFAFTSKREHIAKANMPNMAYPGQHIDNEMPVGSRDHVIEPYTVKITFNLDIESKDKASSFVNNVGMLLIF